MVEIEFVYLHNKIIIQADINDSFGKIIEKFRIKAEAEVDIKNLCFLSNGKIVSKNETIKNIISQSERENKKMVILVQDINDTINIGKNNITKSNDIICPICKEICIYEITGYKIKLFGCKSGHIKENIK